MTTLHHLRELDLESEKQSNVLDLESDTKAQTRHAEIGIWQRLHDNTRVPVDSFVFILQVFFKSTHQYAII